MLRPEWIRRAGAMPWLWGIVAVAVAARVSAALYLGSAVRPLPGIFDQISYHTLALRVLGGHGFSFGEGWWPATPANQPTAHWSFLYVAFLAAIYAIAGPNALVARLVQAVAVGVLHPLLTYRIGRRLFGERVGLAAAGVVACYAYFVYYAAGLVTESLCIVALLWSVDTAIRIVDSMDSRGGAAPFRGWLQLGIACAAASLLRQVMLFTVPVIFGWVAWRVGLRRSAGVGPRRRRQLLAGLALSGLVMAACILPWTIRNYRAFHQFVLLNTNAGFAFYWGNHPIQGREFIPLLGGGGSPSYNDLIPADLKTLDEAALEKALMWRGLAFVAEDPVRILLLSISRVGEYLKFWPSSSSAGASNVARVLSFGLCLPFIAAGLLLALFRPAAGSGWRRAEIALPLGVVLAYSLVHLATWTLIRYRLPVDALLMPFVGLSLVWAHDWIRRTASVRPATPRPAGELP